MKYTIASCIILGVALLAIVINATLDWMENRRNINRRITAVKEEDTMSKPKYTHTVTFKKRRGRYVMQAPICANGKKLGLTEQYNHPQECITAWRNFGLALIEGTVKFVGLPE